MLVKLVVWAAMTALFSAIGAVAMYAAGTVIASAQELHYCGPTCWADLSRSLAATLWVMIVLVAAVMLFAYIVMGDD